MGFEILPHTADIRLCVTGASLEELFQSALRGMAAIQAGKQHAAGEKPRVENIHLTAPDATGLLVDFLNEVLTLSQEQHAVFHTVEFSKLTETALSATVKGSPVEEFAEDIKAVTYHEAEVSQRNRGWEARIIFDI